MVMMVMVMTRPPWTIEIVKVVNIWYNGHDNVISNCPWRYVYLLGYYRNAEIGSNDDDDSDDDDDDSLDREVVTDN